MLTSIVAFIVTIIGLILSLLACLVPFIIIGLVVLTMLRVIGLGIKLI